MLRSHKGANALHHSSRMLRPQDFGTILQTFVNRQEDREPLASPRAPPAGTVPRFATLTEAGLRRRLPIRGLPVAGPHKDGVFPREAAAAQLALRLVVPLEPLDVRRNPPTVRTTVL